MKRSIFTVHILSSSYSILPVKHWTTLERHPDNELSWRSRILIEHWWTIWDKRWHWVHSKANEHRYQMVRDRYRVCTLRHTFQWVTMSQFSTSGTKWGWDRWHCMVNNFLCALITDCSTSGRKMEGAMRTVGLWLREYSWHTNTKLS